VLESWIEPDFYTLYKMKVTIGYATYYFLGRVNREETTFEQVWVTSPGSDGLPDTIYKNDSMCHFYVKE
jgi:hypothetical protein